MNPKNTRLRHQFLIWIRGAKGWSESTISSYVQALDRYERFTKYADFVQFSPQKAIEFRKWLKERKFRNNPISLCTISQTLRFVKKFFEWLKTQPGYKSKIRLDDIDYLKLTHGEERIAHQTVPRKYPSLEFVQNLVASIPDKTEVDRRDRALISFALLSGARDLAISSLPIGCFDEISKTVYQDPKRGVKTKFQKNIQTTLLNFDPELMRCILDWVQYLQTKGYGSTDPIFPRTKSIQGKNENLSFETSTEVEPIFWQSAGMIRRMLKHHCANAGLPYFSPHTLRHLHVALATKKCHTMEQFKAVSQNLGHESIMTTIPVYGNYTETKLSEILQDIDFSNKSVDKNSAISEEVIQEVMQKLRTR